VPAQRGQAFHLGGIGAAHLLQVRADLGEVEYGVIAAGRADDLPLVRPAALRDAIDDTHRPEPQIGSPAVAAFTGPDPRHGGILRRTSVASNPCAVYRFAGCSRLAAVRAHSGRPP
jgi:hypothetical protein